MAALYLIPVTLGTTPVEQVLPSYNHDVIMAIRHFIVEEVRTARRFIRQVDKNADIDRLAFYPMGKHADRTLFGRYLEPLRKGEDMGIISEAGCPAVADPGAEIVAIAQSEGMRVIPLVGPSSIIMSLMASGFNGQNFAFHGYLPVDNHERMAALKRMESASASLHQTQIFIETPFRNHQMIDSVLVACRPDTRLCIAAGITCGESEYIRTMPVRHWRKSLASMPDLRKIPAVFLVSADR